MHLILVLSHVQVHTLTKLFAHKPGSKKFLLFSHWNRFSRLIINHRIDGPCTDLKISNEFIHIILWNQCGSSISTLSQWGCIFFYFEMEIFWVNRGSISLNKKRIELYKTWTNKGRIGPCIKELSCFYFWELKIFSCASFGWNLNVLSNCSGSIDRIFITDS